MQKSVVAKGRPDESIGKKRIVIVYHSDGPTDDRTHTWAIQNGYEADVRRPYRGDGLDKTTTEDVAGTIIHGGPYNTFETERHPFLLDEYRWIDTCMKAQVPMLGICQGCQMIAQHLGAKVGPKQSGEAEFGYYAIEPTKEAGNFLNRPLVVTQAHFHTFELPQGSVRLAGNAAFENQAFRFGEKVVGVQFHPEVTIEGFRRWQDAAFDITRRPGAQSRDEQNALMAAHDEAQARWFFAFLDRHFGANPQPVTPRPTYEYATSIAIA